MDQIPKHIQESTVLTGNNLGQLGNIEQLPSNDEINDFSKKSEISSILDSLDSDGEKLEEELHKLAAKYLTDGEVENAWKVLLQS